MAAVGAGATIGIAGASCKIKSPSGADCNILIVF
jgi:hypothetical protein